MPGSELSSARVEFAIYLVGGLVVGLLGFQMFVNVLLSFYDAFVPGPAPGGSAPFWVDQTVLLFVALVFLFAGFFLLFLAMRARRASRVTPPQS